jgi:hypothetical protein
MLVEQATYLPTSVWHFVSVLSTASCNETSEVLNFRQVRSVWSAACKERTQRSDRCFFFLLQALGVATDILVDPFSLGVWTDVDDTPNANNENPATLRREVRRSRMTSEQKREHNRMLREQRERAQQRQANGM